MYGRANYALLRRRVLLAALQPIQSRSLMLCRAIVLRARRIAGFVLDALEQALHDRRPIHRGGLVDHSDRGSKGGFKRSSQHRFYYSWSPLVKRLRRRFPSQRLSRSGVEGGSNGGDLVNARDAQVCAFREVLTQQPVSVLVSAALPWTLRIAEVDLHACIDLETILLGFSSVPRERRPILDARSFAVPHERGRCSSIVNRVVRSTSVPIAELPRPRMRSLSQCPGTARSAASAGR